MQPLTMVGFVATSKHGKSHRLRSCTRSVRLSANCGEDAKKHGELKQIFENDGECECPKIPAANHTFHWSSLDFKKLPSLSKLTDHQSGWEHQFPFHWLDVDSCPGMYISRYFWMKWIKSQNFDAARFESATFELESCLIAATFILL